MATIRTFVGIGLVADLQQRLTGLLENLAKRPGGHAVRWVPVQNVHVTIKFLGDIESQSVAEVNAAVDSACATQDPFEARISNLGCFPNARRPRIVWIGAHEPTGALHRLFRATEEALADLGYARETRPFSPHCTIGRLHRRASRGEIAALGHAIETHPPVELGVMSIESVAVIRSDLRPAGPIYTDIHRAALGDTGAESLAAGPDPDGP